MHLNKNLNIFWKTILFIFIKIFLTEGNLISHEQQQEIKRIEETPIKPVSVLVGTKVLLPCQVASDVPEDKPILVLFYKRKLTTPVYSLDARDGPLSLGIKWVALEVFGSRAKFDLKSPMTGLIIDPVMPEDIGLYRCRVDYKASPTRNERIMLEVVVPPDRVFISNDAGLEVSGLIGPYNLGATIALTCNVQGGNPPPKITWRKRSNDQESSATVLSSTVGTMSNTLIMTDLTRDDLYSLLTCYVVNSKLTSPLSTSVTLDITFPPLEVNLLSNNMSFKEGVPSSAICEAVGSRPAANITWWKNGIRIDKSASEVLDKGNITKSTLTFVPDITDNDAQLVCRARNPIVPMAVIETSTKIKVLYSPRLKLKPGRSLNMGDIKESDDVYFECEISANPKAESVKWFLNGEELFHKISSGVILSNQSLVLQKVQKSFAGNYLCSASNTEGSGKSNPLTLHVKYVPLCDKSRLQSYGVEHNETVYVSCNVHSNPEPQRYRWAFNTSSELLDLTWVKGQANKRLVYTPKSDLDYGSLLCWAENEIGLQDVPCVYHVIKSSTPSPLKNCSIKNITSNSAYVFCQPGWNGGLEQYFTLNVLNSSLPSDKHRVEVANNFHPQGTTKITDSIIRGKENDPNNILIGRDRGENPGFEGTDVIGKESPRPLAKAAPAPKPNFFLTGLRPNTKYMISVTANNRKGKSRPTSLIIQTSGDAPEKRVGLNKDSSLSKEYGYVPLAIFSSSLAVLLLIFLIIVIILRTRRRPPCVGSSKGVTLNFAHDRQKAPEGAIPEDDAKLNQDGKRTPDVVPCGQSSSSADLTSSKEPSSSSQFHQLKIGFTELKEDSSMEKIYGVQTLPRRGLRCHEPDDEFSVLLPTAKDEKSATDDFYDVERNNPKLTQKLRFEKPDEIFEHPVTSDSVPLTLSDTLSKNTLNTNVSSVLQPSASELSRNVRRTKTSTNDSYVLGVNNTSVILPNLEKFLTESQLESAV